jgi:serine/threonine-protein kinase
VYVQDNRTEDTTVTITVARLDGSPDANPANDSVAVVLERYRPTPADAGVTASAPERGNSGKADVEVTVTASDATLPITLTASYDPRIATPPTACTPTSTGATCSLVGGASLTFSADIDRVRNEHLSGTLAFRVSLPETFEDTKSVNDTASVTVERFEGAVENPAPAATSTQAPTLVGDVVDSTTDARTVQRTTKKTNQLVNETKGAAPKSDATSAKGHAKKVTKPAKEVGTAVGKTLGKAVGKAVGKPAPAGPTPPADVDLPGADVPGPGNGSGNGQGNGNGNGNGPGKPAKVEQVLDTLASLLP